MKTNPHTHRLKWVVCVVVLVDITLTLVGQPKGYWRDPSLARDANPIAAWILHQGYRADLLAIVGYTALAYILFTYVPGRVGVALMMIFAFEHFAGGATWLVYRYRLGMTGLHLYSLAVSSAFAFAWFRGGGPAALAASSRFRSDPASSRTKV